MSNRIDELKSQILDKLFALVNEASVAEIPALVDVYNRLPVEPVVVDEEVAATAEPEPETVEA